MARKARYSSNLRALLHPVDPCSPVELPWSWDEPGTPHASQRSPAIFAWEQCHDHTLAMRRTYLTPAPLSLAARQAAWYAAWVSVCQSLAARVQVEHTGARPKTARSQRQPASEPFLGPHLTINAPRPVVHL